MNIYEIAQMCVILSISCVMLSLDSHPTNFIVFKLMYLRMSWIILDCLQPTYFDSFD